MAFAYMYFALSIAFIAIGVYYLVRVARGLPVEGANGGYVPVWTHWWAIGMGVLGVLASAPSIFTDNPHWFVDKIYFVVSKVIEAIDAAP